MNIRDLGIFGTKHFLPSSCNGPDHGLSGLVDRTLGEDRSQATGPIGGQESRMKLPCPKENLEAKPKNTGWVKVQESNTELPNPRGNPGAGPNRDLHQGARHRNQMTRLEGKSKSQEQNQTRVRSDMSQIPETC